MRLAVPAFLALALLTVPSVASADHSCANDDTLVVVGMPSGPTLHPNGLVGVEVLPGGASACVRNDLLIANEWGTGCLVKVTAPTAYCL